MANKRILKRWNLIYYLKVINQKNGDVLGHLVDITTRGIMIMTQNPIPSNQLFQLTMSLPKEIMGRNSVTFDAECKWCRKSINPDYYDAGFQFVAVSPNDIKTIENLINEFLFVKS